MEMIIYILSISWNVFTYIPGIILSVLIFIVARAIIIRVYSNQQQENDESN